MNKLYFFLRTDVIEQRGIQRWTELGCDRLTVTVNYLPVLYTVINDHLIHEKIGKAKITGHIQKQRLNYMGRFKTENPCKTCNVLKTFLQQFIMHVRFNPKLVAHRKQMRIFVC